jgi:hypothetical protein
MDDPIKQRLAELRAAAPVKRKKQEPFVKVPLARASKVAAVLGGKRMLVWLWILHQSWQRQSSTVTVTNTALKKYGINRMTKHRALKELEAIGAIMVDWRGKKNPVVTLSWGVSA